MPNELYFILRIVGLIEPLFPIMTVTKMRYNDQENVNVQTVIMSH